MADKPLAITTAGTEALLQPNTQANASPKVHTQAQARSQAEGQTQPQYS